MVGETTYHCNLEEITDKPPQISRFVATKVALELVFVTGGPLEQVGVFFSYNYPKSDKAHQQRHTSLSIVLNSTHTEPVLDMRQ